MKRSELLFNLISIFVDFVMILVAGIAAFYLRLDLAARWPIIYSLTLADYLRVLGFISPLLILLFASAGLYNLKGTRKISRELLKIILTVSVGLLVVVILFFFNQTVFPSRLIILLTWVLTILLISLGRMVLRLIQVRMLRRGVGLHKLVVIDSQRRSEDGIIAEIEKRPELGYKIIEIFKYTGDADVLILSLENARTLH